MNEKEQLKVIFETLRKVETKGDSTVLMCDCLRALAKVINDLEQSESEVPTNE